MRIANNIRQLRFTCGEMTQQQLAERAQVTRQTIAAVEKSKYSPSLELAFKISDVFNLPICDVFSFGDDDGFVNIHRS